jgi:hypothetical protein
MKLPTVGISCKQQNPVRGNNHVPHPSFAGDFGSDRRIVVELRGCWIVSNQACLLECGEYQLFNRAAFRRRSS